MKQEELKREFEQVKSIITRINFEYDLHFSLKKEKSNYILLEDIPIIIGDLTVIKTYLHGIEYGLMKHKKS